MLGLLLAAYALFSAEESVRHSTPGPGDPAPRGALQSALAVAETHRTAIRRIRSGADAARALEGTRRQGAVGIRTCADATHALTAYGPVLEGEAPEFRSVLRSAIPPGSTVGFTGAAGDATGPVLAETCGLPASHVWILEPRG